MFATQQDRNLDLKSISYWLYLFQSPNLQALRKRNISHVNFYYVWVWLKTLLLQLNQKPTVYRLWPLPRTVMNVMPCVQRIFNPLCLIFMNSSRSYEFNIYFYQWFTSSMLKMCVIGDYSLIATKYSIWWQTCWYNYKYVRSLRISSAFMVQRVVMSNTGSFMRSLEAGQRTEIARKIVATANWIYRGLTHI